LIFYVFKKIQFSNTIGTVCNWYQTFKNRA